VHVMLNPESHLGKSIRENAMQTVEAYNKLYPTQSNETH